MKTPKHVLDDIVVIVPEEEWSMTKAQEWKEILDKHGIELFTVYLFTEVRAHYKNYDLMTHENIMSPPPLYKRAEKKLCENKYHEFIYLETEEIDHELLSLNSFYCPTCNAFWREP